MAGINDVQAQAFANIYLRAASTMMHSLQQFPLLHWSGPPMVLIRPRCDGDWLSFANTEQTISEGHRAAVAALDGWEAYLDQEGGVFPRRHVELDVLRDRCIGCDLFAAHAPRGMGLDAPVKALARTRMDQCSPPDGGF